MREDKTQLKILIFNSWMREDDILHQIRDWFERWHELVRWVRKEFIREDKIFNNQKKNKDKIWDNTYFSIHSALMAREYIDRPTSQFEASSPAQFNQVKNLNSALDTDFNTQEYENLRYELLNDKYRRWVGIACRRWWDGFKKMPKIDSIDPRLAIFDPDGNYVTWEYTYFWFETNDYLTSIEEKWFFNIWNLFTENWDTDGPKFIRQQDQITAWLDSSYSKNLTNPSFRLYYHFGIFWWQRALVVTWNNETEILFVRLYETIEWLKSFQDILSFRYWRPDKNNPMWQRIAKLWVADLQSIKAEIANLRLDKSKAELYPMYVRNTRLIKNKTDLNFWFNKVIDATPLEWQDIWNAIKPIQRDFRADNSFLIDNSLDSQVQSITWMSWLAQGSSPERREAATTNKILQWNTDINLAFNAKIDSIWEEALIRTWLAWYIDKFEDWDDKIIYIQTWFGSFPRTLKKKDFVSTLSVKIKIETKVEIDKKNNTERIAYWQMIGLLQWLPNRTESAQLNTYRNFGRSWWMSEQAIDMELPATTQELIAHTNIWLLLEWHYLDVEQDYDTDTHLLIIQAAWNWENVQMYKYSLLELKKIKWLEINDKNNESVANNMAAQASASLSNQATNLLNN